MPKTHRKRNRYALGVHRALVMHFKRLGSRHIIHKEIEIPYCVFGFNEIIWKTGLKHIKTLIHKCNIIKEEHFEANMKSHYVFLWFTQFRIERG